MADVTLHCLSCSKTIQVSEFADFSSVVCPECGQPMRAATPETHDDDKKGLQLRQRTAAPPEKPAKRPDEPPSQADLMAHAFDRKQRKVQLLPHERFGLLATFFVMALFAATAGLSVLLRYGNVLPASSLNTLIDYGWIVFAVVYAISFTMGFRDSPLQGILCVLVPGYFFYYLLISDHPYLRAVAFGLLAGLGMDAMQNVSAAWFSFYNTTMDWILSGG